MLVLEFLAGGTLSSALADGPFPVDKALGIAGKLADAVVHMHDKGMLHRDIKPSNVGFTRDGVPKLMDFGLVRLTAAVWGGAAPNQIPVGPTGLSVTGPMPGTIPYMSPESLAGKPPAPREDVWSLSVLTYEMIAGVRPWNARTIPAAIVQIMDVEARPLQDHARETPARLGLLLSDCLAGDPHRRPASAAAFRDAIREIGQVD
jgi:serine/threonine-protein kinase